ncbi:MAG: hypothetical protein JRI71_02095 [Deltaproteobacteria bacterium]|nr:hypothetical protein [Deltaproteobacteria bacterium]MBW2076338.1 hypothetical protein [Deltaproteobacteria bacterium]MBW2311342.1 hypothetical protein [Deltaproteobacteria bacterium]
MTRTILSKRKTKGLMWAVCGILLLCFAIIAITSCEENSLEWLADDSSYEARIEEARIAIDDREYARARDLLLQLKAEYPGDPLILQYLSNAYAGLVGLDTFNLLTTIDQLIEEENPGSIDMVGNVLGSLSGEINVADIDEILANLENAINALEEIPNPTDDQTVQLGLLSLNHAAMTIADIVGEDQNLAQVTLTEQGLGTTYGGTAPDLTDEATTERLDDLSDDIENIGNAVDSIASITGIEAGQENDLSESFDEFTQDVDPNGDDSITQSELQNYLGSLSS